MLLYGVGFKTFIDAQMIYFYNVGFVKAILVINQHKN